MKPIVLAITGASGVVYGARLLERLLLARAHVQLTMSGTSTQVISQELGRKVDLQNFDLKKLMISQESDLPSEDDDEESVLSSVIRNEPIGQFQYHHYLDYNAGMASGSFLTQGMVICPCSMSTLAAIANGLSANLIHRAAHVHLKERRKLIVVPRETPLSGIHLDNMKRLSDAGAVILPAMPGFYHRPKSILDTVDFIVDRIFDQLEIPVPQSKRWGKTVPEAKPVTPPAEE